MHGKRHAEEGDDDDDDTDNKNGLVTEHSKMPKNRMKHIDSLIEQSMRDYNGNHPPTTREPRAQRNHRDAYHVESTELSISNSTEVQKTVTNVNISTSKQPARRGRASEIFAAKKWSACESSSMRRSNSVEQKKFVKRDSSVDPRNKERNGTVYELFKMDRRSRSESRSKYVESLQMDTLRDALPPSPVVINRPVEHVGRKKQRKENGPILTEEVVLCGVCNNRMPKNAIQLHMIRMHGDYNKNAGDHSDEENAPNMIEEFGFCEVCNNRMQKSAIQAHTKRVHGDKARTGGSKSIRCKLCQSVMHSDYMPAHLLRKHRPNIGIGIIWPQFSDDEVNDWIADDLVFIKDGAVFLEGT